MVCTANVETPLSLSGSFGTTSPFCWGIFFENRLMVKNNWSFGISKFFPSTPPKIKCLYRKSAGQLIFEHPKNGNARKIFWCFLTKSNRSKNKKLLFFYQNLWSGPRPIPPPVVRTTQNYPCRPFETFQLFSILGLNMRFLKAYLNNALKYIKMKVGSTVHCQQQLVVSISYFPRLFFTIDITQK